MGGFVTHLMKWAVVQSVLGLIWLGQLVMRWRQQGSGRSDVVNLGRLRLMVKLLVTASFGLAPRLH